MYNTASIQNWQCIGLCTTPHTVMNQFWEYANIIIQSQNFKKINEEYMMKLDKRKLIM